MIVANLVVALVVEKRTFVPNDPNSNPAEPFSSLALE